MWKQYSYIEHSIQGLQDFVDYIFLEVLFHAPEHCDEDLLAVVDEPTKKFLEEVGECKFYEQLSKLYEGCKALDENKVNILRIAYSNNNQIERLCRKETKPFRFKDLQRVYKDDEDWKALLKFLKNFCNDLYMEHVYLKAFQDRYGTMSEYYKTLVKNDSMCHCCGIGSILTEDNTPRDAFDHYLPKAIYPFVSLNFHNLVPTCPHCNNAYKREVDTLYEKKGNTEQQVKAFLPFVEHGVLSHKISVSITLSNHYDKDHFRNCGMQMSFTCVGKEEEVNTWLRIYKIKEQYASFCYSEQTQAIISDLLSKYDDPRYVDMQIRRMENLAGVGSFFLQASYAKAVIKSFKNIM